MHKKWYPLPPPLKKKLMKPQFQVILIFQYFDGTILFSNKDLNNIKIPENSNIKIMQYSHQEGISQWFVYCNFLDDFNICLRYSCIQIKCEFIESVIWIGNTINIYQFEFFFFFGIHFCFTMSELFFYCPTPHLQCGHYVVVLDRTILTRPWTFGRM